MPDRPTEIRSLEAFVRRLPLFADLSAADVTQLCRSSQRRLAKPGDLVVEQGAPGNSLYIILSGELEIIKREGDQEVVLASLKTGEFVGEMSLLEQKPRTASARAAMETELLEISHASFRKVLENNPPLAATIMRTVADRLRRTEAAVAKHEKLASLGTLTAGLAHELNNPAAAIQSSSAHLREAFETWRQCTVALHALALSDGERLRLGELEQGIIDCGYSRGGDDNASREEDRLIRLLEGRGLEKPWEIAPALIAYRWAVERVEPLASVFAAPHFIPVVRWLGAGLAAQQLIEEIQRSSQAIADIVRVVKSYTYLDKAPVQEIDLRESLEDTLIILRHKLKQGVAVVRDYDAALPRVEAYAGELNQVWTNLIDNAIDAMDGKGVLEIHVRPLGDQVEVRIADSGAGIAPDILPSIFDEFFTTKEQGVGTGLGLHITHNIVVNRHRGRIAVKSRPGRTEFGITLPVRLSRDKHDAKGRMSGATPEG